MDDQHVLRPGRLQRRFLEAFDVDVEGSLLEGMGKGRRRDALQPRQQRQIRVVEPLGRIQQRPEAQLSTADATDAADAAVR